MAPRYSGTPENSPERHTEGDAESHSPPQDCNMMRTPPGVPDPSRGCHLVTPTQHAASTDAGPTPAAGPMTSATLPRSLHGPRQRAIGPGGAAGGAA